MKHLRKFNESWIEDMYNSGRTGLSPEYQKYWDEYKKNNARIEAEHAEKSKKEREKWLEENPQHKGLTSEESLAKLNQERREKTESDPNFQFRQAVNAASKNADPQAHQKMIDLLDEHGVDLIKDRRYLILKRAAEMGKEEVMDVLLDALRESGEDMAQLNKSLEEYVRNSRG